MEYTDQDTLFKRKDSRISRKVLRACLEQRKRITAAYLMPEPIKNSVIRLAVVADPMWSMFYENTASLTHDLELQIGEIFDLFYFTESNCPSCKNEQLIFSCSEDFTSNGAGYRAYNEEDELNTSKIRVIEEFADRLEANLDIKLVAIQHADEYVEMYRETVCFPYIYDWNVYLKEYPNDLLIRFLRSRSSHLKMIAPSSPLLTHALWE